ncbi:hypothetical protein F2Q69_00023489 [Brassica cretica]|uniref:Uncharacterized protein n=1 Tax=Brassica cretica TaxID=69181 RepID=A0A8S9Q9Q8_BRACR|nr:hypothetical protein F2Q69_00023489 [Brassica cretica]
MTNSNNTLIDATIDSQTPLNVAATCATGVTTVGNITRSTAAATTSTILPAGNVADETTRCSLFGAGLYQTVRRNYTNIDSQDTTMTDDSCFTLISLKLP